MLTCTNLGLKVGDRSVFSGLSFSLNPNSITYLRGGNGSGKSSLLRMIAGIQKPSAGEILLFNHRIGEIEKPYVNYVGHNTGIKDELTVLENITTWSRLYDSEYMIVASMYYFGLANMAGTKAYTLSAGNRQKLALARLMSCDADLWLLDEVDAHLDEQNRILLNNAISTKANNGGIVLLTSHLATQFQRALEIDIGGFSE